MRDWLFLTEQENKNYQILQGQELLFENGIHGSQKPARLFAEIFDPTELGSFFADENDAYGGCVDFGGVGGVEQ